MLNKEKHIDRFDLRNYIKYTILIIVLLMSFVTHAKIGGDFTLKDQNNNKYSL